MPLSYSQLSTYRRCPKQFEYAFVKKIPRQISAGESFGSSLHNTLKRFGELEMKRSAPVIGKKQLPLFMDDTVHNVPTELTLTTLLTIWRTCFIAEGYKNRAEMDQKLLDGEKVLTHFFQWWNLMPREVIAIEKSFTLRLQTGSSEPRRKENGALSDSERAQRVEEESKGTPLDATKDLRLAGRFDRVERTEEGLHIIDFKSTNPRDPQSLTLDLQLSLYALAAQNLWQEPVAALSLLCLTTDGAVEQSTTRSPVELKDAMTSIRLLAERIASGDRTATPSVPVCRHCPYRDICPVRTT